MRHFMTKVQGVKILLSGVKPNLPGRQVSHDKIAFVL